MITGETLPEAGFDSLFVPPEEMQRPIHDQDNEAFNSYIAIHKVFVGRHGANVLLGLLPQLQATQTPDHLMAAGWAAAEAGLILGAQDQEISGDLFDTAHNAWLRATAHQRWINLQEDHPLVDFGLEFRSAVDIAFLPVFRELSLGMIQNRTLRSVYTDVLNIAQVAGVRAHLAEQTEETKAVGEMRGVRYEINGLLGYNRKRSGEWFAVPALSRSDSGVYHSDQTHDMVVIHHNRGEITRVVPVEMKSYASRRQRARYSSLLVRSKLHLALPGREHPEQVLAALTADYEDRATEVDKELVAKVSQTLYDMVGSYLRGEPRNEPVGRHGPAWFRDKRHVTRRHPGLAT